MANVCIPLIRDVYFWKLHPLLFVRLSLGPQLSSDKTQRRSSLSTKLLNSAPLKTAVLNCLALSMNYIFELSGVICLIGLTTRDCSELWVVSYAPAWLIAMGMYMYWKCQHCLYTFHIHELPKEMRHQKFYSGFAEDMDNALNVTTMRYYSKHASSLISC